MTNSIPQAAIDAAADAVYEAALGQGLFATAALEAAMPHIRKQIAGELRAAHPAFKYAAQIVEGEAE